MACYLRGGGVRAVLWDRNDIADDNSLKLLVARYDADLAADAGSDYMTDTLNRSGDGIRTNKNTIAIVYAEKESVPLLEGTAKTLAGIKKAKKDERVKADRQFVKDIASRENDASAQLKTDCRMVHSNVMYPHGTSIRHSEMRFGESKKTTITEAIMDHLESQGKLVKNIGLDGLEVGDAPVRIRQIYDSFATNQSKPFILNRGSIGEAVREGIRIGKFGYCTEIEMVDGKYVAEKGLDDFDWEGFLVDGDMVYTKASPSPTGTTRQASPDKSGSDTQVFQYTIQPDGFDGVHGFVKKTAILNLDDDWKSSKKDLRAEIRIGDTSLTLNSSLTDHKLLKDILNLMSNRSPNGTATITVVSDSDLEEFFKENELEAHKH